MLKPSPVLEARELRWLKKRELARNLEVKFPGIPFAVAYCTLRMPAPLRLSGAYNDIPGRFQEALDAVLADKLLQVLERGIDQYDDGPSAWIATACSAVGLKRLAIELEEKHPQGALIDIDISDSEGIELSRRDIEFPARRCFVCGEGAAVCTAGQRHSFTEIEARVKEIASK